jgi:hypothetical protein
MRCCIDSVDHRPTIHQPSSIRNADHHRTVHQSYSIGCHLRVHCSAPTDVRRQIGHAGRVQRIASTRIEIPYTAALCPAAPTISGRSTASVARLGAAITNPGFGSGHGRIIAAAADARDRQAQH